MTDQEKLDFGIEIVSAMKANVYNVDIEIGRIMALEDTEIDRMEGISQDDWNKFTIIQQERFKSMCLKEKEKLHKQALFIAEIALKYLEK